MTGNGGGGNTVHSGAHGISAGRDINIGSDIFTRNGGGGNMVLGRDEGLNAGRHINIRSEFDSSGTGSGKDGQDD